MKNFNQYITEKIKLSKDRFDDSIYKFMQCKELNSSHYNDVLDYMNEFFVDKAKKCKLSLQRDGKISDYTINDFDNNRKYIGIYSFSDDFMTISINQAPHAFDDAILVARGRENLLQCNNFRSNTWGYTFANKEDVLESISNWITNHDKLKAKIYDVTGTNNEFIYDLFLKFIETNISNN
jgi:hypothetical protein